MNPYILLVVGVLGLLGCLILLYFGIQMMREERAAKEARGAPEPGEAAAEPAPAAPEAAAPATPPVMTPARANPLSGVAARLGSARNKGNAHEVLRVLRDNLTGRLLLEIGGRRFASLGDLQDPTLYQGLVTTLRDLYDFAGAATSVAAPSEPAPPPMLDAAPAAPAAPHPLPRPVAPVAARPAGPAPEARPLPPPSMNPFKQMQVLRELAKNPPPPPKSISEQIDEVLQNKILGTPLIHRGIHIRPGSRGEAVFDLDGQTYATVDDVPDEAVREVIRTAIAEWERAGG